MNTLQISNNTATMKINSNSLPMRWDEAANVIKSGTAFYVPAIWA